MATIGSTVQLYDNMSPVINGITSALNICISSFESMQAASGQSMDLASLQAARQQLSGAEASFTQIGENISSANNSQNEFNHSMDMGHNHANGLLDSVKNITAGIIASKIAMAGLEGFMNIFKSSDELVQTNSRLGLINDGLRTTADLQNMIYQSAQRSRASYTDTAAVVARLGTLAKDAFSSNEEEVAFAEQMNKQFKIGGSSIEEQTAAMYQLTQAMASGRLQGDEFHSIMENAPLLAQAISDFTGKSMGDLRTMSAKGEITADIIKKALFSTAADTEARFAQIPKTTGEVWTSMKNQALMTFQPVLLKINEIANNPNFNNFINMIVGGFSLISIAVLSVIGVVANVAAFFQNNWSIIEPIIWGIVAALIVYNASLLISNIRAGEGAIAMAIKTVADWAETAAIIAMTVAQDGLNAALAMCPITWIIILIIALVAIFYVAIAVMNKYAGTSLSATGLIMGAFAMFGAYVYNIIAYIWNIISAYVEFFANVFRDPIYSVERLFANLANNVLDWCISMTSGFDQFATNMANAIIKGINYAIDAWNKFVDLLNTAGIADKLGLGKGTELNYTTSITSNLQDMKGKINDWLGQTPSDYWVAPKMDMKSLGGAFDWGYGKGAGLESSASNWMNNLMNPQGDNSQPFDYNDLLSKAADGADNSGKNTKDIKDKLDVTSEDLKYLRDIADRDTINRFTTAEVKVDMTNHNNIGSELDLDGIIDNLGQAVSEGLQSVREGATYEL